MSEEGASEAPPTARSPLARTLAINLVVLGVLLTGFWFLNQQWAEEQVDRVEQDVDLGVNVLNAVTLSRKPDQETRRVGEEARDLLRADLEEGEPGVFPALVAQDVRERGARKRVEAAAVIPILTLLIERDQNQARVELASYLKLKNELGAEVPAGPLRAAIGALEEFLGEEATRELKDDALWQACRARLIRAVVADAERS